MTKVISLGGSIVAPEGPDAGFLRGFTLVVRAWLAQNPANRLILVVGGGGAARTWQKAYRETDAAADSDALDWIGIMATRLNAQLVRSLFLELCPQEVVTDPTAIGLFSGRILVAAGWKPGRPILTPCCWLSASWPTPSSTSRISPRSIQPIPSSIRLPRRWI